MDVAGWLRGLGLGEYEAAFRENEIDAQVLPRLTAEDLKEHRRLRSSAIGASCSPRSVLWRRQCLLNRRRHRAFARAAEESL